MQLESVWFEINTSRKSCSRKESPGESFHLNVCIPLHPNQQMPHTDAGILLGSSTPERGLLPGFGVQSWLTKHRKALSTLPTALSRRLSIEALIAQLLYRAHAETVAETGIFRLLGRLHKLVKSRSWIESI